MNYSFKNKDLEELTQKLKLSLFDITAKNQVQLSTIENSIANCEDPSQEEYLRNLWANYYEALKYSINSTDVLIESIEKMDACRALAVETMKRQHTNKEEQKAVPAPVKENVEVSSMDVPNKDVSSEKVAEAPAVVEEPKEESVSVVELPKEQEVVKNDELPKEDSNNQVVEPAKEEVVVEAVNNTDASPLPKEEVELPKEEVVQKEETPQAKEVVELPKIEENQTVEEVKAPNLSLEEGKADAVTEIPSLPQAEKMVFMKEGTGNAKAILINKNQALKLRLSKDVQSALMSSMGSSTSLENDNAVNVDDAKKQMEEMMEQLPQLYEQGKTEEALAMSEKISVLSKKIAPAA